MLILVSDVLCSQYPPNSTLYRYSPLVESSPSTIESQNHLHEAIASMRSLLRHPLSVSLNAQSRVMSKTFGV